MVLGSLWMVNGLRREARRLARDSSDEEGNDTQRPSDHALGDIELQALGNQDERDMFLPASEGSHGVVLRNKVEEGETLGLEEEEEWETLGFDPVSAFSEQASTAQTANRRLASTLQASTGFISPNGESSSSGPSYSAGFNFDGHPDEPGILPSGLPGAANHWRAERSPAEMKLQRRSTVKRRSRPDSESGSITEDQHPFVQDGPVGRPSMNTRNSWEKDDDAKERYLEPSRSVVGKGKGKEKEEEKERGIVETIADGKEEDKPEPETQGFDLPTGIDLNVNYKFLDGLAYPILPLAKRHRKSTSTSELPITPKNNSSNNNNKEIAAYPFPISFPFTPSPTPPSFATFRSRLPPPPTGKPTTNLLPRFQIDNTPPRTPTRTVNPTPQTPPPARRGFTFSSPVSPYAASPTFTPHRLASPFSIPTPPSSTISTTPKRPQPPHRIPTSSSGHTITIASPPSSSPSFPFIPIQPIDFGSNDNNNNNTSPRSPIPIPSPLSLPSSPHHGILSSGSRKLARRVTIGRGKRKTYRRLGSGLGTVSEMGMEMEMEGRRVEDWGDE
ncbi:MAG: hypothetical protein Q9178_000570 [Gyalolechia marmorata]